jgi:tetratricopeptide (TPR) repeat protein
MNASTTAAIVLRSQPLDSGGAVQGDPGVPPLSLVSTDLKSLCNAITTRYRGVLLMLDEAHFLVDSLDIIQQLRHSLREASPCGIIFTGEQGLNQMFTDPVAPFYLQANIIPVGNFVAKSDVTECALLPLAENERPLVSPMTMDHLGRLSLGKPNQIRLICHSIYQRYLKNEQQDLNITIEVLDDVLDKIQASYESRNDLKQRVDTIRRLSSVDFEILYLITRYPGWNPQDVVALDEAFRGEKTSIRALERRHRRLKQKWEVFVKLGLLQDHAGRYMLAGDEFLQVYLRFFYEVRRYGNLKKQLQLGEGPITPFGEKAEKLVRSLAWEVKHVPSVVNLVFFGADAERGDLITDVRDRFAFIKSVLQGKVTEAAVRSQVLMESFNLCQLIAQHAQYYLLVVVLRNLENPRESLRLEIYFETGEPLVFPLALLTEQAEAAKIQIQEFDSWFVELPTLDGFVRRLSGGHTLDELITQTGTIAQWMVRSVQRLVEGDTSTVQVTQEEPDEEKESGWVDLYRQQQYSAAVEAITTQLKTNPRRAVEARLYNDRGYIRYEMPNESENARRDLERALNLHHRALPLTLLNLSIIAIDSQDYAQAIETIEDVLLITHGRESMRASYLRLRLLPGHRFFTNREKWEQHPANVLEAAYVNLAYAIAHQSGYDAAREVLEESLELLPSSVHLRHALARLHLWKRRADLANPLYQELSEMIIINDIGIANEVKNYLRVRPRKRR